MATTDAVERLRALHVADGALGRRQRCLSCQGDWPCDVRVLLDRLDRLRSAALELLRRLDAPPVTPQETTDA